MGSADRVAGWVALAAFIGLAALGACIFPPGTSLLVHVAYVVAVAIAFLIVCWMKGEPPGWRWGD